MSGRRNRGYDTTVANEEKRPAVETTAPATGGRRQA
jgi:hypothetical protein